MLRRAAVRQAIAAALQAVGTFTVRQGKVSPETVPELPAVNIVSGAETEPLENEMMIAHQISPETWPQLRGCEFDIECSVTVLQGGVLEDELDDLCLAVEIALNADETLGGECNYFAYEGSAAPELSDEIEQPIAARVLTYRAEYLINARDPQALES